MVFTVGQNVLQLSSLKEKLSSQRSDQTDKTIIKACQFACCQPLIIPCLAAFHQSIFNKNYSGTTVYIVAFLSPDYPN